MQMVIKRFSEMSVPEKNRMALRARRAKQAGERQDRKTGGLNKTGVQEQVVATRKIDAPKPPEKLEYEPNERNWSKFARCALEAVNPELFYGDDNRSKMKAIAICGGCVVKSFCLDYAKSNDEGFGVWGGEDFAKKKGAKKKAAKEAEVRRSDPDQL